ncbi:hypothetical protein IMG5_181020, partial [Ichthyophthirius multifiliis]
MNQPKKGILIKHQNTIEKKDITWDEKAIEEHDQQRGKTQKITEPKTPYNHELNYYDTDDIDQLYEAEINKEKMENKKIDINKLNQVLKEELDR